MNILPKKRWHVRTKDNIARVRRDEAEAAEKERQENLRIENANREARLNVLKQRSKEKLLEFGVKADFQKEEVEASSCHINLFEDIDHAVQITNKEHEIEQKEKKEEYEKKIGYLTYLGQDTNEALKKKNWYEVCPKSRLSESANIKDTYDKLVLKDEDGKPKKQQMNIQNGELDWKLKQRQDPIYKFKKYCKSDDSKPNTPADNYKSVMKCETHKTKKHKKDKTKNAKDNLQKLREARLKREQAEKYKTDMFLSGLNKQSTNNVSKPQNATIIKPKYNSQFNPELARQNYR